MKKINPNLLKLAELTHNSNLKVDESILDEKTQEITNVPNLGGYTYVPSINLYVSKEKTLRGKTWYQTHEELHKQGLQMLTIPQFIEFIKYLKNGYQDRKEAEQILDEILAAKDHWRAERLDAKFSKKGKNWNITYHKINNGALEEITEPLEECLMKDEAPGIDLDYWLKNPTKQGLPRKNINDGYLHYWHPRDGTVARFCADSDWAGLGCARYPGNSYSSLGVRTTKIKD